MSTVAIEFLLFLAGLAGLGYFVRSRKPSRPVAPPDLSKSVQQEMAKSDAINNSSGHSRERLDRLLERSEKVRKELARRNQ